MTGLHTSYTVVRSSTSNSVSL